MNLRSKISLMASFWVALLTCAALSNGANTTDDEKKPKHTIKEVMKNALKGDLQKKVLSGNASDEDKKRVLDMYISMVESKPPKGEMNSWHNLAGAAALAAAKVEVGREGAAEELKIATNCKACHSEHKP